jgi:hypothetical protein
MSRVIGAILGMILAVGSADAKTCGLWVNKGEFVPYSTCDYEHRPKARHKRQSHPPRPPRATKHIPPRHKHQSHPPRSPRQSKHIHHHEAHESIPTPKRRPDNLYEKMYRVLHPRGE